MDNKDKGDQVSKPVNIRFSSDDSGEVREYIDACKKNGLTVYKRLLLLIRKDMQMSKGLKEKDWLNHLDSSGQ